LALHIEREDREASEDIAKKVFVYCKNLFLLTKIDFERILMGEIF